MIATQDRHREYVTIFVVIQKASYKTSKVHINILAAHEVTTVSIQRSRYLGFHLNYFSCAFILLKIWIDVQIVTRKAISFGELPETVNFLVTETTIAWVKSMRKLLHLFPFPNSDPKDHNLRDSNSKSCSEITIQSSDLRTRCKISIGEKIMNGSQFRSQFVVLEGEQNNKPTLSNQSF